MSSIYRKSQAFVPEDDSVGELSDEERNGIAKSLKASELTSSAQFLTEGAEALQNVRITAKKISSRLRTSR